MASFTKKVLGLAAVATSFAGMAFGQATCVASATTNIIRAEGTAELVAPLTVTCSTGVATTATAGTASLQVFISPSLPVTGKVLSTSGANSGANEASVQVFDNTSTLVAQPGTFTLTAGGIANGALAATIAGSTINISSITTPALGNSQSFRIVLGNVRVNATSMSIGSGVPPSVSATAFISGSAGSIVPAALASTPVAFTQNGLSASKVFTTATTGAAWPLVAPGTTAGANNFVVCNPYRPGNLTPAIAVTTTGTVTNRGTGLVGVVQINENFTAAFKSAATEASNVSITTGSGNAVNNGTRLSVNFTNVATGVTVYVPNALVPSAAPSLATAIYTNVAAGTSILPATALAGSTSGSITTGSGLTGANGLIAVPLSSGSGSAIFEVITSDANALDVFNIPVYIVTTANGVTASSTPMGITVSLSPAGSTVIPNFTVGSSSNALTGSSFGTCSTSLLFPFVTNQLGFDTGIAIANTSTDPFGSNGATAQSGTCNLNFYGAGAPSPANVATPNVPTGTVYTQVLSGVAAGFQGYMIANCNFQYAHGFAFITNGVGANGGLSQGYLAGVLPDTNQLPRAANPLAVAVGGSGETLGN